MNIPFLNLLTPKEPKFFPLLKQMSEVAIRASELMHEFSGNYSHSTAAEYWKKIKEQEKIGDRLSNRIFDELNTTFITPFDREDINSLANRLDDVTDRINSCAKRIVIYNPKALPACAQELTKLLYESTICINKAVDELDILKKTTKNIIKYCSELHDIENKADDVYENFIISLFEKETDGIELMKVKEIMYELEKATDTAEYVGKIIKTIIVKYA
jgi:predicted phosphate transport protein (TIGR00153 family)